jgi:DNA-binding NarL/FixJ family response regulator
MDGIRIRTLARAPRASYPHHQPTGLFLSRDALILRLDVVAYELSRARSFDEDCLHMTPQRSQIFRAFARGESITRIAESCDISYAQAWSQIRRAVEELERKNPSALDAVRWHNYLMLMRIADQAFAAFDRRA